MYIIISVRPWIQHGHQIPVGDLGVRGPYIRVHVPGWEKEEERMSLIICRMALRVRSDLVRNWGFY